MTRRPRRNHNPAFKAKVALAAIRGEQTLLELSHQFDVRADQIKHWKDQLLEEATDIFGNDAKAEPVAPAVAASTILRVQIRRRSGIDATRPANPLSVDGPKVKDLQKLAA